MNRKLKIILLNLAIVVLAVVGFALVVAIELAARYFERQRKVVEEPER